MTSTAEGALVEAIRAGDSGAFSALAERYRRELHVHCYRMLGSFEDSEDLVQETLLRAWRKRQNFEGRSSFRAWLYRIATNACLDWLARTSRRVPAGQPDEIAWLQPYPDQLLDQVVSGDDPPDAALVSKETIELAFIAAIQHLPPRQRAALILRDVLGWSANETATLLETSVASANSALQRARATLRSRLPERRADWTRSALSTEEERSLLERYMEANDRGDGEAIAAMLREDARFAMPPEPGLWVGRDTIVAAWIEGGFGSSAFGDLRSVLTAANRQPAVAAYLRRSGETDYSALGLDVLRVEGGLIVEIISFVGPNVFPAFGLPRTLPPRSS